VAAAKAAIGTVIFGQEPVVEQPQKTTPPPRPPPTEYRALRRSCLAGRTSRPRQDQAR
jgi:hypothetical protein